MADEPKADFRAGVPLPSLRDRAMIVGVVDGEDVLLTRQGDAFFAVGRRSRARWRAPTRL